MKTVIGIDVGGTKINVGLISVDDTSTMLLTSKKLLHNFSEK